MRNFIYAITLFETHIFFSFSSFLGIQFEEDEGAGPVYKSYCILIFILAMATFIRGENLIGWGRARRAGIALCVLLIYLIIGIVTGYAGDISFLEFGAFCIPACCIGIYYSNEGAISRMIKWFDPIFLFISFSLIFNIKGMIDFNGGIYSQKLSYYAAMCFLLDIFLLNMGKNQGRFPFFRKKIVYCFYIILLPLFVAVSLFSGGRGGFVTIVLGFCAFLVFGGENKYRIIRGIGMVGMIYLILLISFISYIGIDLLELFQNNAGRVFSYLQGGKLDVSETSGRDAVYGYTLELIKSNPLIGYGIFGYKKFLMESQGVAFPHNLFLEWLLQGGVILFSIYTIVFSRFCVLTWKLLKRDTNQVLLLPLLIYPFTELMFSSSYMEEPLFWFTMVYVLMREPLFVAT